MERAPVKTAVRRQIGIIGAGVCGSEARNPCRNSRKRSSKKRSYTFLWRAWEELWKPPAYGAKQEGGITLGILPGTLRGRSKPLDRHSSCQPEWDTPGMLL